MPIKNFVCSHQRTSRITHYCQKVRVNPATCYMFDSLIRDMKVLNPKRVFSTARNNSKIQTEILTFWKVDYPKDPFVDAGDNSIEAPFEPWGASLLQEHRQ